MTTTMINLWCKDFDLICQSDWSVDIQLTFFCILLVFALTIYTWQFNLPAQQHKCPSRQFYCTASYSLLPGGDEQWTERKVRYRKLSHSNIGTHCVQMTTDQRKYLNIFQALQVLSIKTCLTCLSKSTYLADFFLILWHFLQDHLEIFHCCLQNKRKISKLSCVMVSNSAFFTQTEGYTVTNSLSNNRLFKILEINIILQQCL